MLMNTDLHFIGLNTDKLTGMSIKIRDDIEILERIGEGGMGEVYQGILHGSLLDTNIAVKIIKSQFADLPGFQKKFNKEIEIQKKLIGHPNIVPLIDSGITEQGFPYFLMNFIAGKPLSRILTLPSNEVNKMLSQITAALEYAHSKNILHGDVSPHNIIRNDSGDFFLIDFGIGKVISENSSDKTLTSPSIGKPSYLSPKVLQGETYCKADDFYSLGITAYEIVIGEKHLEVNDPFQVIELVRSTDLLDLNKISDKIIRKKIKQLVRPRQNLIMVPKAFGAKKKARYIAFVASVTLATMAANFFYNKWQQKQTDKALTKSIIDSAQTIKNLNVLPPDFPPMPALVYSGTDEILDFYTPISNDMAGDGDPKTLLTADCMNIREYFFWLPRPFLSHNDWNITMGSTALDTREKLLNHVKILDNAIFYATTVQQACPFISANDIKENVEELSKVIKDSLKLNSNPKSYEDFMQSFDRNRYISISKKILKDFTSSIMSLNEMDKLNQQLQNTWLHKVVMKDISEEYTFIAWADKTFPKSSLGCRQILDNLYESNLKGLISGITPLNSNLMNASIVFVPFSSGWKNIKVFGNEIHFESQGGSRGPLKKNGICLYGRSLGGLKYIRYIRPKKIK